MDENTIERHCRNPNCGQIIEISRRDDGTIIRCPKCDYFQAVRSTRLCNIVTTEERNDILKGTYNPNKYRSGSAGVC